jgi:hypothetical protein
VKNLGCCKLICDVKLGLEGFQPENVSGVG